MSGRGQNVVEFEGELFRARRLLLEPEGVSDEELAAAARTVGSYRSERDAFLLSRADFELHCRAHSVANREVYARARARFLHGLVGLVFLISLGAVVLLGG